MTKQNLTNLAYASLSAVTCWNVGNRKEFAEHIIAALDIGSNQPVFLDNSLDKDVEEEYLRYIEQCRADRKAHLRGPRDRSVDFVVSGEDCSENKGYYLRVHPFTPYP